MRADFHLHACRGRGDHRRCAGRRITGDRPVTQAAPGNIAGMIVFLDPGHNGANDASLTRQVPTGRAEPGLPNQRDGDRGRIRRAHLAWDTVLLIRQQLSQYGVRTAMSRGNDDAVGPCVDERAAMANALAPNAVVSVHADGGPPPGGGFHVNYSAPPLNQAQAGPAVQFARIMRDQLAASGIPEANYIGNDGLP